MKTTLISRLKLLNAPKVERVFFSSRHGGGLKASAGSTDTMTKHYMFSYKMIENE